MKLKVDVVYGVFLLPLIIKQEGAEIKIRKKATSAE